MAFLGIGKGKDGAAFYDLLEAQAEAACCASEAFERLASDFAHAAKLAHRIEEIENEADHITHELANKVDSTFVTPLDKEDLNALSSQLDDVTDAIETASGYIALYQLTEARPDLPALAGCLVEATGAMQGAVSALRNLKGGREALHGVLVRVHDAENRGDRLYRHALADLLNSPGAAPILVIKWKAVYDSIEAALDSCEDVSNIVESVAVKYA
jgi:predicted phosphate transport protein (TIGR00153 family)